jgi:hypothetical protein
MGRIARSGPVLVVLAAYAVGAAAWIYGLNVDAGHETGDLATPFNVGGTALGYVVATKLRRRQRRGSGC